MRIKKTSQYINGGASLSNVYGTSNENGYTQEYINNLETYSTSEIRVGTYDGKPLYRKLFKGNLNSTYTNTFLTSTGNIEMIVRYGGNIHETTGVDWAFPCCEGTDIWCSPMVRTNNIRVDNVDRLKGSSYNIWFEYTKTTD